jgi:hypothetical protein
MAFLKDDKIETLRKLGKVTPQPMQPSEPDEEPEVDYDQQQAESLKSIAASLEQIVALLAAKQ